MKQRLILFLTAVWLIAAAVAAGFGQAIRGGQIPFEVDEARFRAGSGFVFLEVYFSVGRDAIEHKKGLADYQADLEMAASLYDGDSLLIERKRQTVDRVASLSEIQKNQLLFNVFQFYIKPGTYKLHSRVTDLRREIGGWVEKIIEIKPYPDDQLCLSDIELCLEITPDTTQSPFVKNRLRSIPNPNRLYGIELPLLYYYTEIYNFSPWAADRDSSYTVRVSIADPKGNVPVVLPVKQKKRQGTSLVETGIVNVASLPSGTYSLTVAVKDSGVNVESVQKKDFFVYRRMDFVRKEQSDEKTEQTLADEFAGMNAKELDQLFEQYRYIADNKEKNLYKRLDLAGKRRFMQDFWRKRDDNPLTPFNEFKQEYTDRLNYANMQFKTSRKPGWRSDQGRIYIMYGKPDDIERYPNSAAERPYEIWHYYKVEGGAQCYFVDRDNTGELRLVHSTIRTELQDYEWRRWLYQQYDIDSSTQY